MKMGILVFLILLIITLPFTLAFDNRSQASSESPEISEIAQIGENSAGVTWSPSGGLIAITNREANSIELWHISKTANQFEPILSRSLTESSENIRFLRWSPDGLKLAGIDGEQLYIWNVESLNLLLSVPYTDAYIAWSPDSELIAASIRNGIIIWDAVMGQQDTALIAPDIIQPPGRVWLHKIDWNPNGTTLVSSYSPSASTNVLLWSRNANTPPIEIECIPESSYEIEWNHIGNLLATHERICNVETGEIVSSFAFMTSVSWSPNDTMIAGVSLNEIFVVDVATGETIWSLESDSESFSSIEWNSDGSMIATLNVEGEVVLWDTSSLME